MRKIRKVFALIAVFLFVISSNTVFAAENSLPNIVAESAVLINADTGKILYDKNIDQKMYPASMTKLLTAMVVLDNYSPKDYIIVDASINEVPLDSSKAGHIRGEVLTIENVIRGLIIPSGNDTANAIASALAKKLNNVDNMPYASAEAYFAELMNNKAKELGCKSSHFENPHGYHSENHYTTARDMALIAKAALKYETIANIADEKSFSGNGAGTMQYATTEKTQEYNWKSHNLLITDNEFFYENANGLKTGFTDEAGSCIAASATLNDENLIAIIFNSPENNRWTDAKAMFEWGFNTYSFVTYQKIGELSTTVPLINHNRLKGDSGAIMVKEQLIDFLSSAEMSKIKTNIVLNKEISKTVKSKDTNEKICLVAPIEKGTSIGKIEYILNDKVIGSSEIFANQDVEKSNIFNSIGYVFSNLGAVIKTTEAKIVIGVCITIIVLIAIIILIYKKRQRRNNYIYTDMPRRKRSLRKNRKNRKNKIDKF